MHHDVNFVVEAFWEQRTDRTVDQTARQRLVLARLGFALEKAARDLARGVCFLDVVNRQGEEVLAWLGRLRCNDSGEHHGVFDVDYDSTAGLACDFAGFHGDRMLAPLKGFGNFIKNRHVSSLWFGRNPVQHTMPFQKSVLFWNDTASICASTSSESECR